jgi:hypothetical protein
VARAAITTTRKMPSTPAATAQPGSAQRRAAEQCRASRDGQAVRHSRQFVHSAERTDASRSTGSIDGQACAHFAQSMQAGAVRRMRVGLTSATRPSIAPYGQR